MFENTGPGLYDILFQTNKPVSVISGKFYSVLKMTTIDANKTDFTLSIKSYVVH